MARLANPEEVAMLWWALPALAGALDGRALFVHAWTVADPLAGGDGLGPLYNATSCLACHAQGGVGGAGGLAANVQLLPELGLVHRQSVYPGWPAHRERLLTPQEIPHFGCGFAARNFFARFEESERQTPALFGIGALDQVSEADLIEVVLRGEAAGVSGRLVRDAEGRPGRFGWKGQISSLADFVETACAQEIGLSTHDRAQASDPRRSAPAPTAPDLSRAQLEDLTAFVRALPAPTAAPGADQHPGRARMTEAGCVACHLERLGPVEGAYTDLLVHDLGFSLADAQLGYGVADQLPSQAGPMEWRTPPLWGCGASAPYLHDGRAATLDEAIRAHDGEAQAAAAAYAALPEVGRQELLDFLASL
jgi:CxxC motif-containing protein (DUF1111 family)